MGLIAKIKEIIYKVKDYDRLESDYCTCLCYFTNNKMSKPNYKIETVKEVIIESIGEYLDEGYNEAARRAIEWLKENKDKYLYNTGSKGEHIPTCSDKMIDEFREYMKDEKKIKHQGTMSLDLYIRSHHPVKHRGTGVFIRDNGQTRELKTVEEVKAHFPDADASDINIREWEDDEFFCCNMTHNLTEMASHVPIEGTDGAVTLPKDYERDKQDFKPEPLSAYNLLWHPETNPLLKQVHLKGKNSDGEDYEEDVTAIDAELIRQACAVHLYIKSHREELSKYNPDNGWGSYDNLLKCSGDFVKVLLDIPAEEYDNYYLCCWT